MTHEGFRLKQTGRAFTHQHDINLIGRHEAYQCAQTSLLLRIPSTVMPQRREQLQGPSETRCTKSIRHRTQRRNGAATAEFITQRREKGAKQTGGKCTDHLPTSGFGHRAASKPGWCRQRARRYLSQGATAGYLQLCPGSFGISNNLFVAIPLVTSA